MRGEVQAAARYSAVRVHMEEVCVTVGFAVCIVAGAAVRAAG